MFPLSARPRGINPDGTITIYCVKCGKEICRRVGSQAPSFRTAICLVCQGYPKSVVQQHYVQSDPTQPPVPVGDLTDPVLLSLYPEEQEMIRESKERNVPWGGILKPLFRALGFARDKEEVEQVEEQETLKSKKLANRKFERGHGGLFEPK